MVGDADCFALVGVVFIRYIAGDAKSRRVEGCLRDEAIWKWDTQDSGDECGQPQQPDVPVETCWFAEGELRSLRN